MGPCSTILALVNRTILALSTFYALGLESRKPAEHNGYFGWVVSFHASALRKVTKASFLVQLWVNKAGWAFLPLYGNQY